MKVSPFWTIRLSWAIFRKEAKMRKNTVFSAFFFILSFFVYANDEMIEDPFKDAPSKSYGVKERVFELGFNTAVNFSNSFISVPDIFQDSLIIDLENFKNGFTIDIGIGVRPFYFKYINRDGWGFGLSTDVDVYGIIDLSGKMLSLDKGKKEISNLNGAAFLSAGIDTFFLIQRFNVKLRPALFYSLAYVKTDASYTFYDTGSGTIASINYDMWIHTIVPMEDMSMSSLAGKPGFDFSFGVDYPLSEELYINSKYLDFDVGINFINIPVVSSKLENYRRFSGSYGSDKPIDFLNEESMDEFMSSIDDSEVVDIYGLKTIKIYRPFKMLLNANWRPFGKILLTVTPTLGFSFSKLYLKPFSLEGGLTGRLSLLNYLNITNGINYSDHLWINSINLAFNYKAIEFNIGANVRAREFIKSWTAYGVGANVGIKIGW